MKTQNGITLVALVITIIVMLILAGVTITMALGEGGIFEQARTAEEKTISSTLEETINLTLASYIGDKYSSGTTYTQPEATAFLTKLNEDYKVGATQETYTVPSGKVLKNELTVTDIAKITSKNGKTTFYINLKDLVLVGTQEKMDNLLDNQ